MLPITTRSDQKPENSGNHLHCKVIGTGALLRIVGWSLPVIFGHPIASHYLALDSEWPWSAALWQIREMWLLWGLFLPCTVRGQCVQELCWEGQNSVWDYGSKGSVCIPTRALDRIHYCRDLSCPGMLLRLWILCSVTTAASCRLLCSYYRSASLAEFPFWFIVQ